LNAWRVDQRVAVPLEDPNFYFGAKPEAATALDMVMGTKGYRRFDWQLVFTPPAPQYPVGATGALEGDFAEEPMAGAPMPDNMAPPPPMARPEAPRKGAVGKKKPTGAPRPVMAPPADPAPKQQQAKERAARRPNRQFDAKLKRADDARGAGARAGMDKDEEWGGEDGNIGWNFAPVRVFPAPTYQAGYDGPRTDFRETIFWAPDVRTDKDGTARVTFYTSDAVTSFRVTAEGASAGGLPGRGEAVIKNKMPLALDARLPLEVSAGDKIELPVTLANETDRDLTADLDARFGSAFALKNGIKGQQRITLRAGEKRAFFFPIEVVSKAGGEGEVQIAVATAGLKDEIHKKIKVVALGFPFEVSFAGTAKKGVARHTVELGGALPGTLVASVKMYPSPLASMTTGAEAILREPGGCFEQTSSSNYPNVMVLQYLEKNEAASPEIIQRSQGMLSRGYKILAGYETKEKGYEWFGETPGHEALTAYGLMEFQDMAEVDDEVDRAMIERTATWLMSRRDGKGGYQRNSRALDSFGRASYETTNGYITWALTEAKRSKDLKAEIDAQRKAGLDAKDPYLVALAANTMLNVDAAGADTAAIVKRLAAMQDRTGHFPGAKESITMSGGESLDIETASLAAIAFMKASPGGEYEAQVRGAIEWLNGKRDGWGAFGSTQGTVLSLKALTRYADYSARTQAWRKWASRSASK